MKKLIVVVFALLIVTSCKKLTDLANIKFVIPYSKTVAVPGLPGNPFIPPTGLTTSIPTIAVESKSEEYIKQYNTSSELITNVVFSELKLEIKEPSTQNFDLVDSIWLFVSASGLPEILSAYSYDIPDGVRTLDLTTSDFNMKEYFLKDSMYFRLQGHFHNAPDSASVFTISSKFDVTANPLKKK